MPTVPAQNNNTNAAALMGGQQLLRNGTTSSLTQFRNHLVVVNGGGVLVVPTSIICADGEPITATVNKPSVTVSSVFCVSGKINVKLTSSATANDTVELRVANSTGPGRVYVIDVLT